jgi:hypothetical protein
MNIFEALKKLSEGHKIRENDWNKNTYLYMDGNLIMSHSDSYGEQKYTVIGTCLTQDHNKWEIYSDKVSIDKVEPGSKFDKCYTKLDHTFIDNHFCYYIKGDILFRTKRETEVLPCK